MRTECGFTLVLRVSWCHARKLDALTRIFSIPATAFTSFSALRATEFTYLHDSLCISVSSKISKSIYRSNSQCLMQRQVARSVVTAIFSAKNRGPGRGMQRCDSTNKLD